MIKSNSVPSNGASRPARHPNPTKDFLLQAERLDARVNALLERKARYMALACKATSTVSGMPATGASQFSRVESYGVKLADLEREIDDEIDRLVNVKRDIQGAIAKVPNPRYRDLLTWRYFNGWTWERIAEELGCDVRHIHRLHGGALVKIQNVIECHY